MSSSLLFPVLLIAAGVITRMRVCLSMFAGSLLLYCVVGPRLVEVDMMSPGSDGLQSLTAKS